jgi:predicted DNA-binding transcriptional regulator AlpA
MKESRVSKLKVPIAQVSPSEIKLLTRAEVCDLVGVTYVALWTWIKRGHFPAGRSIGEGPSSHIAWLRSEVEEWILNRPKRYPKGTSAKARASA